MKELQWVVEGGAKGVADTVSEAKPASKSWRRAMAMGLAAMALIAVTGIAVWNLKPPTARRVTRSVIALPPGESLSGLDKPAVALSPDGSRLVYVATRGGIQHLYLRAMDQLESGPLPGTEGARLPFFSPDGQRFLMIKEADEDEGQQDQINVVQNWFEELKRLVPTP